MGISGNNQGSTSGFNSSDKKIFRLIAIFALSLINITLLLMLVSTLNASESISAADKKLNDINGLQVELLSAVLDEKAMTVMSDYLRMNKVDVVSKGSYYKSRIPYSLFVIRNEKKEGLFTLAEKLAIKPENILIVSNKTLLVDATIIIGTDFPELSPFNRGSY